MPTSNRTSPRESSANAANGQSAQRTDDDQQRSGAAAYLVLLIVAGIGYLAGGLIAALALPAAFVALCMLVSLFDDAKKLAEEAGAVR